MPDARERNLFVCYISGPTISTIRSPTSSSRSLTACKGAVSDPRHRANHGYLPDSDAEQAFAILLDRSRRATVREGELIDLAPSLLEFMGRTPPESMKGRRLFGG